jgi:hypothetical protein
MRDRAVNLLLVREQDQSGYSAFLDYPNGVKVEVHTHSWRKLVNMLKSFGLDTSHLFEEEVADGMGLLERVLR